MNKLEKFNESGFTLLRCDFKDGDVFLEREGVVRIDHEMFSDCKVLQKVLNEFNKYDISYYGWIEFDVKTDYVNTKLTKSFDEWLEKSPFKYVTAFGPPPARRRVIEREILNVLRKELNNLEKELTRLYQLELEIERVKPKIMDYLGEIDTNKEIERLSDSINRYCELPSGPTHEAIKAQLTRLEFLLKGYKEYNLGKFSAELDEETEVVKKAVVEMKKNGDIDTKRIGDKSFIGVIK